MKILVLGAGFVGAATAERLQAAGHTVTVTTTTPAKVEGLRERFEDVVVLRGSDRELVAAAASEVDAVVVTAGPQAQRAMTPEDRAATYHHVLVETARNVVDAPGRPYLVALSSLSVYGSAADHLPLVSEDGPVTDSTDPSPSMFLEMERTYLEAGDRACVFRCGDVFGPGDHSIAEKVAMAHQYLGGSVPFARDALLYRLAVDDAADAVAFALATRLTGVFNLTHAQVPPTNASLLDALCEVAGNPPLTYRAEIAAPAAPISVQRLADRGFTASRSFDLEALHA